MNNYFIGWLISVCIWACFMAGLIISHKRDDFDWMVRFNVLQTLTLIPMWVFMILGWGE